MLVKELIKHLSNINPEATVYLFGNDDEQREVYGISVCDNDDDIETDIALVDKETFEAFI